METRTQVNELMEKTQEVFHKIAVQYGMSDAEYSVFYYLLDHAEGTQGQIGKAMGMTKQTVHSAVSRMIEKGYLEKEKKKLRLSGEGRKMAQETVFQSMSHEEEIFRGWSKRERKEFLRLLAKYLEGMKEYADQAF